MSKFCMPLLDHYAGLAMQGMLANPKLADRIVQQGQSWIEESAWKVAESMIKVKESLHPLRHKNLKEFEEISIRTRNALYSDGIETYGELMDMHPTRLTKVVNLGKVGQAEVAKLLDGAA